MLDLDFATGFDIGGVIDREDGTSDDLIGLAGSALGNSKKTPGQAYWLMSGDAARSRETIRHTHILQEALGDDSDRLQLVYQVITPINTKDSSMHYVEALARIRDEAEDCDIPRVNEQLITPGVFLPIARTNGLIPRMTIKVLEQVRLDMIKHKSISPTVNIDAPAWDDANVFSLLEDIAQDYRLE